MSYNFDKIRLLYFDSRELRNGVRIELCQIPETPQVKPTSR